MTQRCFLLLLPPVPLDTGVPARAFVVDLVAFTLDFFPMVAVAEGVLVMPQPILEYADIPCGTMIFCSASNFQTKKPGGLALAMLPERRGRQWQSAYAPPLETAHSTNQPMHRWR